MNPIVKAGLLLFSLGSVSCGGYFLYVNADDFPIFWTPKNSSLRNSGETFEPDTLGAKYPSFLLSTRASSNSSEWNNKKVKYANKKWDTNGFFKDIKENDPDFISKAKKGCMEAYKTKLPKKQNNGSTFEDPWELADKQEKWREVFMMCRRTSWTNQE